MALLKGHLSIFACSRIFVTFDNVIIMITRWSAYIVMVKIASCGKLLFCRDLPTFAWIKIAYVEKNDKYEVWMITKMTK